MVLISRDAARNFLSYATLKQCPSVLSSCMVTVCCILFVISLLALTFQPNPTQVHVVLIETDKPPVFVTDEKFLSIGLDSSLIADGFRNFHMTSSVLINLMKALAPGYIRIGGTMADRLWFQPNKNQQRFKTFIFDIDGGECAYEDKYCKDFLRPNFTMSGEEWLALNKLASKTGFVVLFDLNSLMRYDNGSWNSENAEKLIEFSNRHNLKVIWQLGNEPNSFRHVFNYQVNASQLAKDFYKLRNILDKYPRYKYSLIVGPDTTRPRPENTGSEKYLKEFLLHAGGAINAISWHQYYFNGRTATLFDFVNPNIFDLLISQTKIVKGIVNDVGLQNTPIWLGETASAYGGGCPGYSNRFIGTYIWLDKLGIAAKYSLQVVIRQSIFKGYYALINEEYEPTPDWWLSVLHKNLVGPEVVPCQIITSRRVRLYCQCTKKYGFHNDISGVTVFGMNMQDVDAKIRIQGLSEALENLFVFEYTFSPHLSLLSKYVQLNGEILLTVKKGELPPIKPVLVKPDPYLTIPPFSIVFWVIPTKEVKACTF